MLLQKSNISNLKMLGHYIRPYSKWLVMAFISVAVSSLTILIIPWGLRDVLDHLNHAEAKALLNTGLIGLLAVVSILGFSTFSRIYFMTWAGERIVADIRQDVYLHTLTLSSEYHEKSRIGDILSRLTSDIAVIQLVVGSSIGLAFRHLMMIFGGTISLFLISERLACYILLIIPVVVLPIVSLGRRVQVLSRQNQEKLSDLTAHIEENVSGIKTVQAFGRVGSETKKFNYLSDEILLTAQERIKKRALLTALVILLVFSGIGFVLWLGGSAVIEHKISGGDLTAFLFSAILVATAVGSLSEVIGDVQRAAGAAERLLQVLQVESTVKDAQDAVVLPADAKGEIEFDNVNFAYPSAPELNALKNFSLKILPGEKIALVGPSGAGKSTVFEVLMRFYDTAEGSIKIDSFDLHSLRLESIRHNIGIVSQDPMIFSTTASQNIEFGSIGATDKEIANAAEAAAASEFITRLPNGYQTYIGEKGVRLSGGQKQRLAIARMILKNPKILLLDEATSSLDSENERLVHLAIENISRGRTTIIIAHRLSTIKFVDRIVVLNEGRIEAIGTHKDLLESSKLYKNLAELQFRDA